MDHTHATGIDDATAPGSADPPRAKARFFVAPRTPEGFTTLRVGALRHNFHEHPLMQLPELEKLARDLAATGQCRFIAPGTRQDSSFNHAPTHPEGREIADVFRRIEEPGSWIALYNVETHPTYRQFVKDVIDSVRPMVEREQGPIFLETGFIFISAPPSVTPFHIDRENNFWLQMKGRKTLNVWDPTDREMVAGRDVDAFIVNAAPAKVQLTDRLIARGHGFDVVPGEGVFFPSTSPHMTRTENSWVRPGDGVSVSIGVNFYTSRTRRSAYAHAANLVLRKAGLRPRHPGESAFVDAVKYPLGKALIVAKQLLRGYKPRAGF